MKKDFPRFAATRFFTDHRIPYYTEGFKQCKQGWIQIDCPFCTGNPGPHLGWNTRDAFFHCWRCGFKKNIEAIQGLTLCTPSQAKAIAREYREMPGESPQIDQRPEIRVARRAEINLPSGTGPLNSAHRRYLTSRDFDPDELVSEWKIAGTGPVGDYKLRIIIPIYYEGKLVTYQGRAISKRSQLRYKACPKEDEARNIKTCLYGYDDAKEHAVAIVEGVTDAWRLGKGAVATFGITYTIAQLMLLKKFRRRFIVFDSTDPQASEQACKLSHDLCQLPGETMIVEIDEPDPASMSQGDADAMMEEFGL